MTDTEQPKPKRAPRVRRVAPSDAELQIKLEPKLTAGQREMRARRAKMRLDPTYMQGGPAYTPLVASRDTPNEHRRPGSLDAFSKPSMVCGVLVNPKRVIK